MWSPSPLLERSFSLWEKKRPHNSGDFGGPPLKEGSVGQKGKKEFQVAEKKGGENDRLGDLDDFANDAEKVFLHRGKRNFSTGESKSVQMFVQR